MFDQTKGNCADEGKDIYIRSGDRVAELTVAQFVEPVTPPISYESWGESACSDVRVHGPAENLPLALFLHSLGEVAHVDVGGNGRSSFVGGNVLYPCETIEQGVLQFSTTPAVLSLMLDDSFNQSVILKEGETTIKLDANGQGVEVTANDWDGVLVESQNDISFERVSFILSPQMNPGSSLIGHDSEPAFGLSFTGCSVLLSSSVNDEFAVVRSGTLHVHAPAVKFGSEFSLARSLIDVGGTAASVGLSEIQTQNHASKSKEVETSTLAKPVLGVDCARCEVRLANSALQKRSVGSTGVVELRSAKGLSITNCSF